MNVTLLLATGDSREEGVVTEEEHLEEERKERERALQALERVRAEFETVLPKMVYISGALTDMPKEQRVMLRAFYEALGRVCKEAGYTVYLPHIYGDPQLAPSKTPAEVDRTDRLAVTLSCFVLAYVGIPSTGVGIEIEMACHAHKPVILLYERERLDAKCISRLVRGNPAIVSEIGFADFDDAVAQLRAFLVNPFFAHHGAKDSLPLPLRRPSC